MPQRQEPARVRIAVHDERLDPRYHAAVVSAAGNAPPPERVPTMARRLGNAVGRRLVVNEAPAQGVAADRFFELVYGRAPNGAELARLEQLLPGRRIESPAQAHRMLLAFDAQSHPTPFLVRATSGNLERVDLDDFMLWIDADDPAVSTVIGHERAWEKHVADVLCAALHPGATFVDVGANVGYHTFLASSLVGPTGAVIAFEPSGENCRLLQLSKTDNDAANVAILPFALDRTSGVRYLTTHLGSNGGLIPDPREHLIDGRGTPVHAARLDDVAPEHIDVMKIDVEGAEFRVVDGGRATIERDRPVIIMEFSCEMSQRVAGVDPRAALQDLLDMGYRLSLLDRATCAALPFESAAALLSGWDDPFRIEDLLLQPV
jgi:FkbM family methyltransferase